jgi:hypothetical protein
MNEGAPKNTEDNESEKPKKIPKIWGKEIWDFKNHTREEILDLKDEIEKELKKRKKVDLKYTSEIDETDSAVKGIALEAEASLTMRAYGLQKTFERLMALKETIRDVKKKEQEIYILKKANPKNEEKIKEQELIFKNLQIKMQALLNDKTIDEDTAEHN